MPRWSWLIPVAAAAVLAAALAVPPGAALVVASAAALVVRLTAGAPAWATLACVYAATLILTELVSNGTAAVLMMPIAIESAARLKAAPLPFVMAVAFAASAAFAIPMGYQVLLLVYGAGGYRLRDYILVGLPLDLILAAVAIGVIPIFYPL